MLQQERTKLLFGPYRVPKCRVGGRLVCRVRRRLKVAGIMDAPMQWPYAGRPSHGCSAIGDCLWRSRPCSSPRKCHRDCILVGCLHCHGLALADRTRRGAFYGGDPALYGALVAREA